MDLQIARIAAQYKRRSMSGRWVEQPLGIKTRMVEPCRNRDRVKETRDVPCCGGKIRREELFVCSDTRNPAGEAWSAVCQSCVLDNVTAENETIELQNV